MGVSWGEGGGGLMQEVWLVHLHINALGTEHNTPLAYAAVIELHRPISSTIGEHGGRLERERERFFVNSIIVFKSNLD